MRYVKQIDYETVYSFRKEGVLPYFPGSAYDADSVGNACRADYPILAFFSSSASIGKLLDIARKKVFHPTAKEGNSRATC